jgi:uncharacterized protein (DUF58 family)
MMSDAAPSLSGRNMRALPFYLSGAFFIAFALASVLLIPFHLYYPAGIWLPISVDAMLLLIALVDLAACPSVKKIGIERPLPFPLAVDRPNEIVLETTNLTGRPITITIRDDVPERCLADPFRLQTVMKPGSGTRLKYRLTPLERGNGEFGDIHFWVSGPFGLVWKHGQIPAARTVKLYPGLALIERSRMRFGLPGTHDPVRALRQRGEGTEFESLREYVVGDDSRLIHWSTSARKGKPIVRENRMERSQVVLLVLDAGRMMTARVREKTKLDYSLNASLLLAYAALELGDHVGVMVVGQDVLAFLPPSKSRAQFGRILDATYALAPRMEEPRFYRALSDLMTRLRRRCLVVVFTDLIDERASEGLLRYSLGLLPRHLPLVVAMSDTEVINLADEVPKTKQDLYRVGVAAELLDRRENLLARLRSAGALVMDVAPDRVSTAVLDRYLEIKTRSLL